MEIILGKRSGFCYGAGGAVEKANNVILNNKEEKIYCLGELVHNKQVIDDLKDKGIIFIDDIDEINERTKESEKEERKIKLIIRAHGIEKNIYEKASKRNIELLDYTCPNVLEVHKIVEEFVNKDYYIVIMGEKSHPETIGTYSFANGRGIVLEKEEDIKKVVKFIKERSVSKLLIIAQTTFSLEKFNKYVEIIKEILNKENANIEIEVRNTICNATKLRQEETEEISSNVDYMIVIGGKKSANSIKLYEISKKNCKNTVFIETYKELEDKVEEITMCSKVGIMAGASTPKKSIDEVIDLLNSHKIYKS